MNLTYCPTCGTWDNDLLKRMDTRDFYELCQEYRWAKPDAAPQFEAIKEYLLTGKLPWPSYDDSGQQERG